MMKANKPATAQVSGDRAPGDTATGNNATGHDPSALVAATSAARLAAQNDDTRSGREYASALAAATDRWLNAIVEQAVAEHRDAPPFALVAVGGYGRAELAPHSDIDVLLIHTANAKAIEPVAASIWYPIWDSGVKLGHAVRQLDEQMELIKTDLDTATAILDGRWIAGDRGLAEKVIEGGAKNWNKRKRRFLAELAERAVDRDVNSGDVAYVLEPDLKEGHGGLRDVHSIWWAQAADVPLTDDDSGQLAESYDTLLTARVALHQTAARPGDILRLDLQDAAAAAIGVDADRLMADIAAAGRHVAWLSQTVWRGLESPRGGAPREVAPGIMLINGETELAVDADPAGDPTFLLRIATVAARHEAPIGRRSLDRLAALVPDWPHHWPAGAVDELAALLLEGRRAIPVLEALDQKDLIVRMLPEWAPNRSKPQRNAYHRFTVDRHLWEAAANAAELAGSVSRPDLLVLGALFHDIGKGYPGDHTEAGMQIVAELAPRLGVDARDTEVLVKLVQHHLLLPDEALRRDVSDPATIAHVAEQVGSLEVLKLLHALTIADSKATGPSAWSAWKEELVNDLVERVSHVVTGGDIEDATQTDFPDAQTLNLMAAGEIAVDVRSEDRVILVYPVVPGALYRIAGSLSLHGLDVVTARADSEEQQVGRAAMGAAEFRIEVPDTGVPWDRIVPDVKRALAGQLAIDARLADRARTYQHRRRPMQAADPVSPSVQFNDEASSIATVIEVRAPTRIGILYAITDALTSTGCTIRHANVQTVGSNVFDTFYVRDWNDHLITDLDHRSEIVKAVLHGIG